MALHEATLGSARAQWVGIRAEGDAPVPARVFAEARWRLRQRSSLLFIFISLDTNETEGTKSKKQLLRVSKKFC